MRNLWKDERGSVSYLLLVEFLFAIFVSAIAYMLIEDVVGFFNINFYAGTAMDVTNTDIQWTSDVLNAIFKYIFVFAVVFFGIRALLESMINQR